MEGLQALRRWMRENPLVCIDGLYLQLSTGLSLCFVVAMGAEEPLAEHMMVADFFRK
jgi:hypothetical protein